MSHKAIVAQITEVTSIPNADRIHLATVLGERVVVSKEWDVGFTGVFLPVDVQISEEFAHHNNLNRDSSKNADQDVKGFFDANRRVRAQPFLKVRSEGFFTTLNSLDFTGADVRKLKLGETFDELNGVKICQKYISEKTKKAMGNKNTKQAKKTYAPFFEKHVDSIQFKHFADNIPKGALLSFHAKIHGTSARMAYTKVTNDLNRFQRFVNRFLPVFTEYTWDYVVGTRNVVLMNGDKESTWHGSEQFRFDAMEMVKPYLEKGMTVYGEIAGYANGKTIMPNHDVSVLKSKEFTKKYGKSNTYAYGCKEHEFRLHIYRITVQAENGSHMEFTQKQLEQWCVERGLNATTEVHPQIVYDGDVDKLRVLVDELTERPDVLTEDYIDPSQIGEGIIIRVDSNKLVPQFYKSKSFAFRAMESGDDGVDIESAS